MYTNEPPRFDLLLLDWGIGGLSVFNEVRKRRPDLRCLYLSDSGATPYGQMAPAELTERLVAIIGASSVRHGIKHVIIACNAASTAREAVAARLPNLCVVGMIEAGVEAVRAEGISRVGLIGGIRTVESGVYQGALAKLGVEVVAQPAQPLSALIERGVLQGDELDHALGPILTPLNGIPALLLACTHYPAVAGEIAKALPGTRLLDPAPRVARAADEIEAAGNGREGEGASAFFTTGDCASSDRSARLAFGVETKFQTAGWLL
jgi:glutamate racemase